MLSQRLSFVVDRRRQAELSAIFVACHAVCSIDAMKKGAGGVS